MKNTKDLRIKKLRPLISPGVLLEEVPLTIEASQLISQTRETVANILSAHDDRLLVIVGPCSIHDTKAALEYADRLQKVAKDLKNELCIIMRVYFEKPRTTIGWKGLINDPYLNGSFNINKGLLYARQLLLDINQLGVPTGSEFLDTVIPQYISDLVSWSAIGARTSESQIHRELVSGLSMPVGFKNGTTGNIQIAVDGVFAAKHSHHFLGVTKDGIAGIVSTEGNPYCHVILRGSNQGPNYDLNTIQKTVDLLQAKSLYPRLMIDCSHGNSNKDYKQQKNVIGTIYQYLSEGNSNIFGVMIESNLVEGKQVLGSKETLTYGKSITDGCIGWNETMEVLNKLSEGVRKRREITVESELKQ